MSPARFRSGVLAQRDVQQIPVGPHPSHLGYALGGFRSIRRLAYTGFRSNLQLLRPGRRGVFHGETAIGLPGIEVLFEYTLMLTVDDHAFIQIF